MELEGTFKADDISESDVSSIQWGVTQELEHGFVQGAPLSTEIDIVISGNRNTKDFYEWAADRNKTKNGTITFTNKDGANGGKIQFKEAGCSGFKLFFDKDDNDPMKIAVQLSVREISFV